VHRQLAAYSAGGLQGEELAEVVVGAQWSMRVMGDRRRFGEAAVVIGHVRRHSLIKTLLKAGIITERTRAHYGMWVNLDELVAEGDRMVGDEVAEEGIRSLKEINAGKRKVVRRISG